jgi:hypothetical protein
MKVVLPIISTHLIVLIPRFYPLNALTLELKNEVNGVISFNIPNYLIENGKMYVSFNHIFTENDRFEIKITENNEVVYRGKLFCTAQTPQQYSQTKDIYIYE